MQQANPGASYHSTSEWQPEADTKGGKRRGGKVNSRTNITFFSVLGFKELRQPGGNTEAAGRQSAVKVDTRLAGKIA